MFYFLSTYISSALLHTPPFFNLSKNKMRFISVKIEQQNETKTIFF